ncbi:hypothetical protein [Fluviicola sp.]|uniref:hypothetical protein n=1 Tax=Fluviicola sp. TaxID=1917219 RepID=UPI002612C563|nr:hypothetical protein [Fluviicola sp.]
MRKFIFILSISFSFQIAAQTLPDKFVDFYEELESVPFNEKFKILDKAIKNAPNEPWYYWMMASVYDLKGDNDKAIENFEKSLKIDANFSAAHASLSRLLRYNYMEDTTKILQALEHINTAIKLEPKEDYYRIDRGYIYLLLGKFDLAENEANYALNLPDFDVMAAEQLKIETLNLAGKKEELKEFVKQHDLSNEGEFLGTNFCLMLASVYEEIGEQNKACKLYHGAAEPYLIMEEEIPEDISQKLKICK